MVECVVVIDVSQVRFPDHASFTKLHDGFMVSCCNNVKASMRLKSVRR